MRVDGSEAVVVGVESQLHRVTKRTCRDTELPETRGITNFKRGIMNNEHATAEETATSAALSVEPVTTDEQSDLPPATFADLIPIPAIVRVIESLGFTTPTPVQRDALPLAFQGRDLIVQARTGSGKTLVFALPVLAHLAQVPNQKKTFCLVVVPTRELAVQVTEVVSSLDPDLHPVCLIGGEKIKTQIDGLEEDPRVVIGTPGRILDMIRQHRLRLDDCRYFALDEADEMLSLGFLEDVRAILSRLPDYRQGLFISATITPRVQGLANTFLTRPETVVIDAGPDNQSTIEHCYCEVGGEVMSKPMALCDLIETLRPRSAIIFCNTKSDTELVEALLRRRGFDARRLNSDLTQAQRNWIMAKIKGGELQFIVGTDIAARGLDIEQIDLVFNYSLHEQSETYVHRTGRTGRAGRSGRAISLLGPQDLANFHYMKKTMKIDFKQLPLPTEEEVAGARLAHLYEIVRETHLEIRPRDQQVAAKLLQEAGEIANPEQDLVNIVAKLCRFAVERYVPPEVRPLEEEYEKIGGGAPSGDRPHRSSRSGGDRGPAGGRGGDRNGRGGGRGGDRGGRSGPPRRDDGRGSRSRGR